MFDNNRILEQSENNNQDSSLNRIIERDDITKNNI